MTRRRIGWKGSNPGNKRKGKCFLRDVLEKKKGKKNGGHENVLTMEQQNEIIRLSGKRQVHLV